MAKTKNTKHALLMSVLSLIMCVSMLIGSTFAWFTDSVTSAGNKIVAGTLDVQLLMNTGNGYKDISDSTAPIFGEGSIAQNNNAETLWEPGKTQVAYLAIKNNGNLALKYTVGLDVQNVSKDLYKVMQYAITPDAQFDSVKSWAGNGNNVVLGTQAVTSGDTVMNPGDTHYFALSIHMDEMAGNEYQGGEVNFDLTVLATQATVEADSFGSDYDKNATNPTIVRSLDELKAALATGGNVMLGTDIVANADLTLKEGATLYGNGNTLSNARIFMKEGSTVDNVNFDGSNPDVGSQIQANDVSVTIKDCTFKNTNYDAIQAVPTVGNHIVIDGCTFASNTVNNGQARSVHIEVDAEKDSDGDGIIDRADLDADIKLTLTNNHFDMSQTNISNWNNTVRVTNETTFSGLQPENITASGNTYVMANREYSEDELKQVIGYFHRRYENEGDNQYVLRTHTFEELEYIFGMKCIGTVAMSAEELKNAFNVAKSGDVVALGANISDIGNLTVKAGVTLDGQGYSIFGNSSIYLAETGDVTVKNVNFKNINDGNNLGKGGKSAIICSATDSGVKTVTGCTFDNVAHDGIQITTSSAHENFEINVVITDNVFTGWAWRYIHVEPTIRKGITANLTITGNKMYTAEDIGCNIGIFCVNYEGSTFNISNNYASDLTSFYSYNGDVYTTTDETAWKMYSNFATDETLTKTFVPYVLASTDNGQILEFYRTEAEAKAAIGNRALTLVTFN